jgi:phage-related protein
LPAGVKKQIGRDIRVVQRGWPRGKPLVDGFGDGLFEIRSTVLKSEYRLLFCIDDGTILILHGFQKKTRATRQEDIALARKRQKEQ